jgi:DNA-binding CsgD family transcriptional regulator/tetratricopeptide (TPR) repeat protein
MAVTRTVGLLGHAREREMLARLLANVHSGQSGVLVLRGAAGIGKTALLQYAAGQAADFRLAQIAGVEAEMELPFASVHQLCTPMLAQLDALEEPQRTALSVALGLAPGDAPDRFLVALAVLSLLAAVAGERPLVCFVDDAQWVDHASGQVLGFVARRLLAESVALVFAIREPNGRPEFEGLPELRLDGLGDEDARTLLARVIPGRLDERVRDRIIAETGGNPLALSELPHNMSPAELAGGFDLPAAGDLPSHIEEHYLRRVDELPGPTRRLMLLAAADAIGDATLVWRAAHLLEIETSALAAAEDADLLKIGSDVRFRHPLVRSAVYRAASLGERRRVHAALAQVSDPDADADRRAWHRALAAPGRDEDVATELERSAERAQTRGGVAATAAFLERAAALTVDQACRARRALAAARAKHQAGEPDAARALLASAQVGPLDALQCAEADLLRAQIAFTSTRGSDAPALLLGAAKQLEPLDVRRARETYLEALMAAQFAGPLASGAVVKVADAALAAPPSPSPRAPDLLLDGLAAMITEGHETAAPLLKRALDGFRSGDIAANGGFRWLWLAEAAAQEVWDHDTWYDLAELGLQLVREAGALTTLPLALHGSICAQIYAGELAAAAASIDEQSVAIEATGTQLAPYGALILAAWRGRESDVTKLIDATLEDATRRGEGIAASTTQWVTALLHNGLGRYDSALAAAQQVIHPARKLDATVNLVLPELIEAATRSGQAVVAHGALQQLCRATRPSGSDYGLGLEARSRALLSKHELAEDLYREAVERLGRTRLRGEHARAHLLYGEWLRREGRRKDAREQLRTAHGMFTDMGMEAFAERSLRELAATGGTVRKRRAQTRDELTPQEWQIARLASGGLSNPEIGARLFLSPRTVEYHLHKVFTKLGIRSRWELAGTLPASASAPASA